MDILDINTDDLRKYVSMAEKANTKYSRNRLGFGWTSRGIDGKIAVNGRCAI